jgi:PhoPQ-activated pathogenicity-related protein
MRRLPLFLRRAATCIVLGCGFIVGAAWPAEERSDVLASYVAKSDPTFEWRQIGSGRIGASSYIELLMVSQTWRGFPWKHQFFVLRPDNMSGNAHQGLLFIHGGRWKEEYEVARPQADLPREAVLFARLAEALRAPVGVLRQVPYQPLFDRREDALIAYSFDRYLQTGESDWPLLLPMVKSAVRAMDVMQQAAQQRWNTSIDSFTVTGASKRGWTSWLTAAIDPRVAGVAPMVIDVLNMPAQIEHQRATWGSMSEQISDYSQLQLPTRMGESDRGRELLSIVDPYNYREQLGKPKLILLGTNDRYWPLDALKLYWPGLPEPKRVLYVANQAHSLRDVDRVIGAVSALHRYTAAGQALPELSWKFTQEPHRLEIDVVPDRTPQQVVVWSARSPGVDFRDARWRSHRCVREQGRYVCSADLAKQGYTAAFAEVSFEDESAVPFSLSTTVCIAGRPSSDPALAC